MENGEVSEGRHHSSGLGRTHGTVQRLRAFHESHATRPLQFRKEQLQGLRAAIEAHESDLLDALHSDLRKPPIEAYTSEIGFVQSDIDYALRHLGRWVRPRRRRSPLIAWPARSAVYPEPYGVALIIGPYNYPFQLLFSPLVGAIAAGNCVCLKPSELTPATAGAIARVIREAFPPEYVAVVEGGRDAAQELIAQGFDYLFFTGSSAVGRAVMQAAARHLTPVTLELGGKSPCIVFQDARPDVAARRILWGKCMNAGQTCVAPDFVLVDQRIEKALLDACQAVLHEFYPDSPRRSPDYGRIVNRDQFDRLVRYLGDGHVVCGGEHDASDFFIAPTILTGVDCAAPVMQEEIFGPILPVLPFSNVDQVFAMLRARPKPLALYLFTGNRAVRKLILSETVSGGVCINDTMSHIMGKDLPLAGVGDSGMGSYHGKAGFDCFTHYRSVLRRPLWPDPSFRYPPAGSSLAAVKRVCRFLLRS